MTAHFSPKCQTLDGVIRSGILALLIVYSEISNPGQMLSQVPGLRIVNPDSANV